MIGLEGKTLQLYVDRFNLWIEVNRAGDHPGGTAWQN
jgi:hypothetical protein